VLAPLWDEVLNEGRTNIFETPLIIDDFLDVKDQEFQKCFSGEIWSFGWKSNSKVDYTSFWHHHFYQRSKVDDREEKLKHFLSLESPISKVWGQVEREVSSHSPLRYELLRVYANALTHGLEGRIHTDSDGKREVTALLYVNPIWPKAWAGETVFYLPHEEVRCVQPKPGRLVIFNGSIPHVARAVSRDCNVLRITLMYKFRIGPISRDV
jgi:SM-20-related protein